MMRGFDSIESMNADSVLVKRQRGSKRFVACAVIIGCAFFLVGILIGYFSRAQHHHNSTSPTSAPFRCGTVYELRPIDFIITSIKEDSLRDSLRQYTTESSLTGMPGAVEAAQKILSRWKASGLDRVYLSSHQVPVSLPNQSDPNKVEIIDPASGDVIFTAQLQEPSLRAGESGGDKDFPGFIPSSPAGEVNADVVYANYGRLEDFEYLKKTLSLDISGKIIVIRLGRIYAGNKVLNAQQYGASAVILYPDPAEFNPLNRPQHQPNADSEPSKPTDAASTVNHSTMDNHGYPESWWLPPTGVRREPLYLMSRTSDKRTPKIPCVSISYEDASFILRNLSGPVSPASWHGGLFADYKTGPGFLHRDNSSDLQVRVKVANLIETRALHNVIGVITGSEEPDRYVIIGHHHDTVVKGTVDGHAGSAALDQLVSVFGQLKKLGHKPRRTIIFCSWDGGEQGSLGSSTWLNENLQLVKERAVAYLDIGVMVEGNYTLQAMASPLLQSALYDAAKLIYSPDSTYKSLYEHWLKRPASKASTASESSIEPKVSNSAGGVGDHFPFYYNAGVSIVRIKATFDREEFSTESYPLYHTAYDSLYAYETFCDPGFKFTKSLTQLWGALILNLVNTSTLPIQVARYSESLKSLVENNLVPHKTEWIKHDIQIDDLRSAVKGFEDATASFQKKLTSEQNMESRSLKQRIYNDHMMKLERAFIDFTGLTKRPSLRHVLFGPSITDEASGTAFPGIQDALNDIGLGKTAAWGNLKKEIRRITEHLLMAAKSLEQNPQL